MLKPNTGLTVALAQRGISRRPFIHSIPASPAPFR